MSIHLLAILLSCNASHWRWSILFAEKYKNKNAKKILFRFFSLRKYVCRVCDTTVHECYSSTSFYIHIYGGYFVYGRFEHKLSSYENAKNRLKPVNENKTSNSEQVRERRESVCDGNDNGNGGRYQRRMNTNEWTKKSTHTSHQVANTHRHPKEWKHTPNKSNNNNNNTKKMSKMVIFRDATVNTNKYPFEKFRSYYSINSCTVHVYCVSVRFSTKNVQIHLWSR